MNAKNITSPKASKKLDWKKYGPYTVIKRVGNNAYQLALPANRRIYDVFHAKGSPRGSHAEGTAEE